MPMLPPHRREPEAEQGQPQRLPDYDSLADSMLSDGFDATTTIGFVEAVQRQQREVDIDRAALQSSENKEGHDSPDQVPIGTVKLAPLARAGDWALSDIFERHPPEIAGILATFEWPIADVEALARLFSLLPKDRWALVGCEFTASVRQALEVHTELLALSVDKRRSEVPGMHSSLDLRRVLRLAAAPSRRALQKPRRRKRPERRELR